MGQVRNSSETPKGTDHLDETEDDIKIDMKKMWRKK
jgi:hypothetical protein